MDFCANIRLPGAVFVSGQRRSVFHWLALAAFVFGLIAPAPTMAAEKSSAGSPPLASLPPAVGTPVDFARDVQPLLTAHCAKCHGAEKQKGGWRVDLRAAALKGGDSGPAFIAGQSAGSHLIQLVAGTDPDKVMPPKGERLTPAQIGLLRAWIDQGATWPDDGPSARVRSGHWSLQPVPASAISESVISNQLAKIERPRKAGKPAAVALNTDSLITSPLDAFITARLATNGLALLPPADRVTLIRRLSFDLTGLPPTPGEIDAFVASKSPRAYEELVERLLASPHYGERWARHWLDIVRYTESQGFEYDKLRDNAWHYRDYVVRSFNSDKPYDRFMKEQIAGDVLEPVTSDGIVGASLLVCGPWDEAGNAQANQTQRAITREEEMEDLVGTVGQTFLGLTVNCARCHSHKFDPIPQEEYFRIKSVFDGVKHGERGIASPAEVKSREETIERLQREMADAQDLVSRLEADGWKRAAAMRATLANEAGPQAFLRWDFADANRHSTAGELKGGAVIEGGRLKLPEEGAYFQSAPLPVEIREKTLEAWVSLADLKQGGGAAISIESDDGRTFDAIVFGERESRKWVAGSSGFARTKDLGAPEETAGPGMFVHLAIVYRPDNSIAVYRNGEPYGTSYTPSGRLQRFDAAKSRVLIGLRHTGGGRPWLTGEIQRASLYDRALTDAEVAASFRSSGLAIPQAEILAGLTAGQRAQWDAARVTVKEARERLNAMKPVPVSYVGRREQPKPTRRLRRGDVKSPEEVVTASGLSAVADLEFDFGLPPDAPEAQRRLKFADWLADARNPLPARVMVNRVWQFHFGQGLVSTPNDFGVSGARPTHPELLDWLAAKFVESGWSVKALHRRIVNSAVYRQGAGGGVNSETEISNQSRRRAGSPNTDSLFTDYFRRASALDADNTLLWRFQPRRLEAEAVRDAMLAASGQLNRDVGGRSYRPFDALKFPANAYVPADKLGPEFNRRTIYRMNVNSGKEPLLDAFDCPDPSVKTPRRGVTTTPLQALGLMNNSFVQRQAAHLAERALREAKSDLPRAIQVVYRHALGRAPSKVEAKRALAVARERSLENVCWALLNSTEFVYVR